MKTALLVIDMQNDYLWENRKKLFSYNNMYSAYKKSIDDLSYKASHDELTGVYNRSGYDLLRHTVDLATTAFLLFDADVALYYVKDHGRHGCCFYEPEMRDKPEGRD